MSDSRRILTERDGHVLHIVLDRADKMNAFDLQMLRELGNAFTAYEAEPELRCAVLYANGDNFTAGPTSARSDLQCDAARPYFHATASTR